jgi:AcrR family transcriptional regulator
VTGAARSSDQGSIRLARLPPGRHGLPRELVTRNQRDRLAAGTIAAVAKSGFNETTISQICAAAGVSRRTFYTYFSSKEECYLATSKTIVEHLRIATEASSQEEEEWPMRVKAKLRATLEFLAVNPDLARFVLIAAQRAGREVTARYRATLDRAVDYLCEGRPSGGSQQKPSDAVAASLMGGLVALIVRKVEDGEGERLPDLLPDLVELFLTPYIGRTDAVRVTRSG